MKKKDLMRTISTLQNYVDRLSTENETLKYLEKVHREREDLYQLACEKVEFLETVLIESMLDVAATMQSPMVSMNTDASKRFSEILEKMDNSLKYYREER